MNFLRLLIASTPIFEGVFVKNEEVSHALLHQKAIEAFDVIQDQTSQWIHVEDYRAPGSLHVTSYFMGGNPKAKESHLYKEFKQGINQYIKCYALAVCRGRIVTCIVKREDYAVPIENTFPHMTAYLGSWKAVDSNLLMETIFDSASPLFDVYPTLFEESEEHQFYTMNITAKGETEVPVYLVKFSTPLILDAFTKYSY